jgi:HSP20 family protein
MAEGQQRKGQRGRRTQRSTGRTRDESARREGAGATIEQGKANVRAAKRSARTIAQSWTRPLLRVNLPKLENLRRKLSPRPRVHVIDHENELVVRAEVPGFSKEQLDVALTNGDLLIRAHEPPAANGGRARRREVRQRGFERKLSLPCPVEADGARGSVKDGVLELVLPKIDRTRPRAIAIR